MHRTDQQLVADLARGDETAADRLFRRHHRAALRQAVRVAGHSDADDVASIAFQRALSSAASGSTPIRSFRPYLYAAIRSAHVDLVRRGCREVAAGDAADVALRASVGDAEGTDHAEADAATRAFTSLPANWRKVLWLTVVEDLPLDEVAERIGSNANAVAALSFRARDGLRKAYLAEHLPPGGSPACDRVIAALPRYVRGSLRRRASREIESHLASCRSCAAALAEIDGLNRGLHGVALPALLAAAHTGGMSPTPVGRLPRAVRRLGFPKLAASAVVVTMCATASVQYLAHPTALDTPVPVAGTPTTSPEPETRPGSTTSTTPRPTTGPTAPVRAAPTRATASRSPAAPPSSTPATRAVRARAAAPTTTPATTPAPSAQPTPTGGRDGHGRGHWHHHHHRHGLDGGPER